MVKIGNTYFAEDAIEAIVPEWITDRRSDREVMHSTYDVHLASGNIVCAKATEEEIAAAASLLGLLIPEEVADENEAFTFGSEELEELQKLFVAGYKWAARDRDGKAFAYKDKPRKGNVSWQGYEVKRLRHEFESLAFENEEPLDLTKLFVGVPG